MKAIVTGRRIAERTRLIVDQSEFERLADLHGRKIEWAVSRTPILTLKSVGESDETSCCT